MSYGCSETSAYVIVMDEARAAIEWHRCLDQPCVSLGPRHVTSTDGWSHWTWTCLYVCNNAVPIKSEGFFVYSRKEVIANQWGMCMHFCGLSIKMKKRELQNVQRRVIFSEKRLKAARWFKQTGECGKISIHVLQDYIYVNVSMNSIVQLWQCYYLCVSRLDVHQSQ